MIDTKRFKKMRSIQDIKLEKAKLRYEMLLAEKNLEENLGHAGDFLSLGALASRFKRGLNTAIRTYSLIAGIFIRKRKKDKYKQVEE